MGSNEAGGAGGMTVGTRQWHCTMVNALANMGAACQLSHGPFSGQGGRARLSDAAHCRITILTTLLPHLHARPIDITVLISRYSGWLTSFTTNARGIGMPSWVYQPSHNMHCAMESSTVECCSEYIMHQTRGYNVHTVTRNLRLRAVKCSCTRIDYSFKSRLKAGGLKGIRGNWLAVG